MLAGVRGRRVFHLAALLSTRAEFTRSPRIHVTSRAPSTCSSSPRSRASRTETGHFVYPSSIATYGSAGSRRQGGCRPCPEDQYAHPRRCTAATSCTARAGTLLHAVLQTALGRRDAARRFPVIRFPVSSRRRRCRRAGRRATHRDDSRGGEGPPVRVLRPAGHHRSLHGDARRLERAADAGATPRDVLSRRRTHRGVQSIGGGKSPRGRRGGVPRAEIAYRIDASGKGCGLVAGRCGRTRPRAPTGDSGRAYDFDRAFRAVPHPTILDYYKQVRPKVDSVR